MKIAPSPFCSEGSSRWPYWAAVRDQEVLLDHVCKRFKIPVGKRPEQVHIREKYIEQMEIQAMCMCLADEFNNRASRLNKDLASMFKKITFSTVWVLEVSPQPDTIEVVFYNMEKELRGDFVKYSNNAGYVSTKHFKDTLLVS